MEFREDNKTEGRAVFEKLSPAAQEFFIKSDALSVWEYPEEGEQKYAYRMRGCHIERDLSLEELDRELAGLNENS